MIDFTFITARLATGGGISSESDVQALKNAGVTAIIDCRIEFDDQHLLASSGLAYLWNGTADDGAVKPPEWFARSLTFALPLLAQPRHRIYAHCAAGINRGPSISSAIMMAWGLQPDVTEKMIRQARPQVGLAYFHDAIAAVKALGYA